MEIQLKLCPCLHTGLKYSFSSGPCGFFCVIVANESTLIRIIKFKALPKDVLSFKQRLTDLNSVTIWY